METLTHIFAACVPGLEALLADEIVRRLPGVTAVEPAAGGVAFRGDVAAIHRANLELGLASHVLLRIGRFEARRFPELVRKASRLPWSTVLRPGVARRVRATCSRSRLYHSVAVAERVERAIAEALGDEPQADRGARAESDHVPVAVRIVHDACTISLDTSGAPLHRRGWRLQTAKAPLREDLARALILASGWDARTPLVDPLAGSGTIVIEAACLARNLAPGRLREFALERTALFDETLMRELREAATQRSRAAAPAPILASDHIRGAIEAATGNAERAGVSSDVRLVEARIDEVELPIAPTGAVVTNPPYGRRIGRSSDLRPLYEQLGDRVRALGDGWTVALVVADRRLAKATGLALEPLYMTDHGGTKIEAMVRRPRSRIIGGEETGAPT